MSCSKMMGGIVCTVVNMAGGRRSLRDRGQ